MSDREKITRMPYKDRVQKGLSEIRNVCQKWGIDVAAKIDVAEDSDPFMNMQLKPALVVMDAWKVQEEKAKAEKAKEDEDASSHDNDGNDQGKGPKQDSGHNN